MCAGKRWFSIVLSLLAIAAARPAEAEDGAYGRLEGDVDLAIGAGTAIGSGGPSLAARADAVYLETAGIYAHYADALGSMGPAASRSIAGGVTLRPLFLARYASDLERGPARLDLLIDSIALDVGAFWHAERGAGMGREPGLELALGMDLPLLARATGPRLGVRGALRWRAEDLAGGSGAGIGDRGALLTLTLSWHQLIGVGVVDLGDELVR